MDQAKFLKISVFDKFLLLSLVLTILLILQLFLNFESETYWLVLIPNKPLYKNFIIVQASKTKGVSILPKFQINHFKLANPNNI